MKHIIVLGVIFFTSLQAFEKISYTFSQDPVDVVIPCHPKDCENLGRAIASIKKYVQGVRRIITVSSEPLTDQAEWVAESCYPFSKRDIALAIFKSEQIADFQLNKPRTRMGWIYQQFLKLFAPYYIPGISSNVLIVDSDVEFLKPITFLQKDGAGLYAVGTEYHHPYFIHAERVLPGLRKLHHNHSGIVHHMLFQKPVLDDFFALITNQHGVEPWIALAQTIPVAADNTINASAMSEYEMYFNFVFARTDQVKIRNLIWANVDDESTYKKCCAQGYDYVAKHIYIS